MITNLLNLKKYIGQSRHSTPDERFGEHCRATDNYYIHNAMREDGIQNFKVETLFVGPHSSLDNAECYFAREYKTYVWDTPGGYNMVWCGGYCRRGIPHKSDSIKKMSDAKKGKEFSDEHRRNLSISHKGYKHTPKQTEKMRKANTGKKRSEDTKAILRKQKLGDKNPASILVENDIRIIRIIYNSGHGISQIKIAAMFGVKQMTISDIIRGATWTQVT